MCLPGRASEWNLHRDMGCVFKAICHWHGTQYTGLYCAGTLLTSYEWAADCLFPCCYNKAMKELPGGPVSNSSQA